MNSSHTDQTQFLDLPGGRLAYDVSGPPDGPLVLCAPGMGDIRAAFRFTAPALTEAGYRVARMDQRGHGESSSGWASYGSPATGDDMLALVRHLGGPAAIIGHSSSAAAAVWAAAEEPALVSALVLIAPFARQRKLSPVLRVALAAVTSSAAIWSRVYYPMLYKAPKPADFPAYLRALRANLREPGRMAATRGAPTHQAECFDRAGDVSSPVRIVMGSKDPDFPDPAAEGELARQLIGAHNATTLTMIDGAGHYPHAELPGVTASAILAFLAEVAHA